MVERIIDVLDLSEMEPAQTEQGAKVEISKEELLHRLEELKEALDTFEADKAEELISQMRTVVYGGASVYKLLEEVRQDVDDFEFSSASEKVEILIQKVEGGEVE